MKKIKEVHFEKIGYLDGKRLRNAIIASIGYPA